MYGRTRITASIGALAATLALLPAAAAGAAQPLFTHHDRYTDSFSGVLCGVGVDVEVAGTENFFVYADDTIKGTGSQRAIATNPLNGKSVVLSSAGQVRETSAPVVDEAAGTITFFPTFKGLPGKIQTAGGSVLLRDAGIIAFADTFDLETGELVGRVLTAEKGPHPEADSDFTRSCDVITPALS